VSRAPSGGLDGLPRVLGLGLGLTPRRIGLSPEILRLGQEVSLRLARLVTRLIRGIGRSACRSSTPERTCSKVERVAPLMASPASDNASLAASTPCSTESWT
jgi:hypothetical protein